MYEVLENPQLNEMVATVWDLLGQSFKQAQTLLPVEQAMDRKELSFHDQIRLLAYLCFLIGDLPGDIVEIGVWKGKSLSLMNEVCNRERRVIGIDPFALPKQYEEFSHYKRLLFQNAVVLRGVSELCAERFQELSPTVALLHIDGGHEGRNVLLDFLLYSPSVVQGGFVVFDDYMDVRYSPEVGPAVDLLRAGGYFNGYNVLGSVRGFENSYLIQKI
ncbi:class I SAM-dependent methyltransferase [Castellaniella sp.]|uniref:class I SAM-dependent methyltransferase n=1 Tax=Castellaniella sp. TaxID=1955812 RepID=UPI002AFF7669|nr:class I SAM-dependent methyltransferase [Castellaniella sp.]